MRILGIIPSRYASSRFPGKPLCLIDGKTMIQRVYEQALKCRMLSDVMVATDDQWIADHVASFSGNVMMTAESHRSGTERCNEVVEQLILDHHEKYDVIINIQGDEPFIDPGQIAELAGCFSNTNCSIATLVKQIADADVLRDPNTVKVIMDKNSQAICFSRSVHLMKSGLLFTNSSTETGLVSSCPYRKTS